MNKGKCKWFNNAKGYGFVTRNDDDKDFFIHFSHIDMEGYKTLLDEDDVTFDIEEGPQGLQATKVKVIKQV